jgi:hypothetical protein
VPVFVASEVEVAVHLILSHHLPGQPAGAANSSTSDSIHILRHFNDNIKRT